MAAWARLVPLIVLWAVPVAAVVVAVPLVGDREQGSVTGPLPSVVEVGSRSADYRTAVAVTVELAESGQVRSPVAGTLTSVTEPATPGSTSEPLRSGQELFAVDGVPVLAQRGVSPLFRELRQGAEGADVEVLARFLADAGLLSEDLVDGDFGRGVRAGVVELQERLGVARPDGVYRTSYTAYVPAAADALGDPLLAVGSPVAAGDPVLTTAPAPARVTFAPTTPEASLTPLEGSPLVLLLGDQALPVSALQPTTDELPALRAGLREAVADGTVQLTGGSPGGSNGSASTAAAASPEAYAGGLLALAEPQVRGVVPGTTVHLTEAGTACVFRHDDASDTGATGSASGTAGDAAGGWSAVRLPSLEPAVGELGAVFVDADLTGTPVARDPLTLPEQVRATCA
jgi:hypothetical protein